jgi:repressor LexA
MRRVPGQTRQRVYEFVRARLLDGEPPSVREIQQALGLRAVQSVQEHLEGLVAEGRLIRSHGKFRSYRLPEASGGPPALLVPVLGRVQAGLLTEAVEEREGTVPVAPDRIGAQDRLFALRVRGDSMMGAGILAGDLVIVRQQATADTGDIVVALVGEEATVKRLVRQRDRLELHPANPDFAPIVIRPPEELVLLGRVIEVRRYLDGPGT